MKDAHSKLTKTRFLVSGTHPVDVEIFQRRSENFDLLVALQKESSSGHYGCVYQNFMANLILVKMFNQAKNVNLVVNLTARWFVTQNHLRRRHSQRNTWQVIG